MSWSSMRAAAFAPILLLSAAVGSAAEFHPPLPYATMYEQLKVGMSWRQAHEITKVPELQREPADFEATDLLRLEQLGQRCQAQLLRLHWHKGELHWLEYFQLDPGGVTYQERGEPDPIAERLVTRLTEISQLYASKWEELTAAISQDGSPTLRAKAKEAQDELGHRLKQLRGETGR